jgi:hypothetical protein
MPTPFRRIRSSGRKFAALPSSNSLAAENALPINIIVFPSNGSLGVGLRVFVPACLSVGRTASAFNACAFVDACGFLALADFFFAAGRVFADGFAFAFFAVAFFVAGFLVVVFLVLIFFLSSFSRVSGVVNLRHRNAVSFLLKMFYTIHDSVCVNHNRLVIDTVVLLIHFSFIP